MNIINTSAKRPFFLLGVIFFIVILILVFILELRMFRKMVQDYDTRIQEIAINDVDLYIRDLEFLAKNMAQSITILEGGENSQILKTLKLQDPRIKRVDLLDKTGQILYTTDITSQFEGKVPRVSAANFVYDFLKERNGSISLRVTTPLEDEHDQQGHLSAIVDMTSLKTEIMLKYSKDKIKVALFDEESHPLVWPFSLEELQTFSLNQTQFQSLSQQYRIEIVTVSKLPATICFFFEETNYLSYRIMTIIILLFALYFLIYQFVVEVLKINTANSYFENIDFEILNNLNEGIMIANRFDKIVFANRAACRIFNQKQLIPNKSKLKDIIGSNVEADHRITLKSSEQQLEIDSAPIFKDTKHLGTLVVISISREIEKLHSNALLKLSEVSSEGLMLVDKNDHIVMVNMMANFYLGNVTEGIPLKVANSELADLIRKNIGITTLTRARLSELDVLCELVAVYNTCGTYMGTLVLFKRNA